MPFFKQKGEIDGDGYRNTDVSAREVTPGRLTQIKMGKQVVLLTRHQGHLFAFSNICPHAAADLSQGRYSRGLIKCPDHSYTFDIRTGRAVWPEDEVCRLSRFAVKETAGSIWIKLE